MRRAPQLRHKPAKPKSIWLEEYRHCGCSNATPTKKAAIGYCRKHGNSRRRITELEIDDSGFAGNQ